jgi:hypothetical protein
VCFGLVGSRPGPVTAAALYAMMGRAAAAGGDGSYSSRSARRGAGGGAAGRGESVRQRGGMGRASVPGPSMAAERGGAGRGVARPPAQCEAARRGGAGEVEERASPLRARPSATPHASVGPAAHVRQRSARPSAAARARARRPAALIFAPSARRARPLERARPSAAVYDSAPALPSESVGPCLSCAERVCMRRCAHITCQHALSETSSTVSL